MIINENILAVPMLSRDKILGVLGVFKNGEAGYFTKDDRDIALFLSAQASVALDNANLILDQEILFLESMMTLAKILDERDKFTPGHSRRVVDISVQIGQEIGFTEKE